MMEQIANNQIANSGKDIDVILQDTAKRAEILQSLGIVEFLHLTLDWR